MNGFGPGPELAEAGAGLVDLIHGLKDAMSVHDRWLWDLNRSLICNLPLQQPNKQPCAFEVWHANARLVLDQRWEEFDSLKEHHQRVQTVVGKLIQRAQRQRPVPASAYDEVMEEWHSFREGVQRLERALWYDSCLADPLTGLRNRHAMMLDLKKEKQRALREGQSCIVAMLDVDHFKSVNDRYGHVGGDSVLRQISTKITSQLRAYDRIYRYGGEEFLLCLPDTELNQAGMIVERLRSDVAHHPFAVGDDHIEVTVSIGLTTLTDSPSVQDAIATADRALYVAKMAGRNRVVLGGSEGLGCFTPEGVADS